jgi:hypothetical protein
VDSEMALKRRYRCLRGAAAGEAGADTKAVRGLATNGSGTDPSILFSFERIIGSPGAMLTSCKGIATRSFEDNWQLV